LYIELRATAFVVYIAMCTCWAFIQAPELNGLQNVERMRMYTQHRGSHTIPEFRASGSPKSLYCVSRDSSKVPYKLLPKAMGGFPPGILDSSQCIILLV
jgi:hypothetical protein